MNITSANKVAKEINPNLEVVKGDGYFYIVFDDGDIFNTHSIYDSSLRNWSNDMMAGEVNKFLYTLGLY